MTLLQNKGCYHMKAEASVNNDCVVDQCGWTDNMMCQVNQTSQDFLLDHHPEAVITIKRNSIGIRPSSSKAIQDCPNLTPYCTTNSNNNNVLKAGNIQRMLSIKSKFSIDKIESDVMRVAVSVQECVKIDHASNEL